jgi:hypothetical protein
MFQFTFNKQNLRHSAGMTSYKTIPAAKAAIKRDYFDTDCWVGITCWDSERKYYIVAERVDGVWRKV